MQCWDPSIAMILALPDGHNWHGQDPSSLKWEYAISMDHELKELELLVQSQHLPHELRNKFQAFYGKFRHPIGHINYQTGTFQKIFEKALPEHIGSNKSINVQFIQELRVAFNEDVQALGELPAHFTKLQLYKHYETRRMASEMGMGQFDEFQALRTIYESFMQHKVRSSQDYAVQQLKQSKSYQDLLKFLILKERVDDLEYERVDDLEARMKKLEVKVARLGSKSSKFK